MKEPFELISEGLEYCEKEEFGRAKQMIQDGIVRYRNAGDLDGAAFGLGRLGFCYEKAGDLEEAEASYEEAIGLGTDIPAIYSGLVSVLVRNKKIDRVVELLNIVQQGGDPYLPGNIHYSLVKGIGQLVRSEQFEEAHDLVQGLLNGYDPGKESEHYWEIRFWQGHTFEKEGRLETAIEEYRQAIEDGSRHQKTFKRCLILLEKLKHYDLALKVIQKGLKIQNNAAWETDLRKREQRILKKTGALSGKKAEAQIPDFTIRKGKKILSLVKQVEFRPQLLDLALNGQRWYGITGGKKPKLFARDISIEGNAWSVDLAKVPSQIQVTPDSIILLSRDGKIGDGRSDLAFYNLEGQVVAEQQLPDVPSEMKATGQRVYVGCRDGGLYAYSAKGESLWRYAVSDSEDDSDFPSQRPCPYYLAAGRDRVAFSSYDTISVLTSEGKLLYRWAVPEETDSYHEGPLTISFTSSGGLISLLAMEDDGNRLIASTYNAINVLENGRVIKKVKLKEDVLSGLTCAQKGHYWAAAGREKVTVYQDRRRVGSFSCGAARNVKIFQEADRILAWSDRVLTIASCKGTLLAEVEFAKRIRNASCLADGSIMIGTRYLILMQSRFAGQEKGPTQQADKGESVDIASRTKVEAGIPVLWMEAQKISSGRGKAIYRDPDGVEGTIEQHALQYFRTQGYVGAWTENHFWWTLMSLLFWDVIYARLPGVYSPQMGAFPGTMQDMPYDMFSPEFYARRKNLIQKRLRELRGKRRFRLSESKITNEIKKAFRKQNGTSCRMIEDWDRFSLEVLLFFQKAMTNDQLLSILTRLLENFTDHRSGLPDLFLVDSSGQPFLVEVKAENEKVAVHQMVWLQFLQNQAKIPVSICRVIAKESRKGV